MYVIGRNDTEAYLGNTGMQSGIKDHEEFKTRVKTKVALENNIDPSIVSMFYLDDGSNEAERIINFESFDLVWTGGEPNEIGGVDFSPQDNKRKVKVTTDKEQIAADGVDAATLTFQVYLPDGVTIDTSVVGDKFIPVDTPTKRILMKVTFIDGSGFKEFKKVEDLVYGNYIFPSMVKEFNNLKIIERASVNIYL